MALRLSALAVIISALYSAGGGSAAVTPSPTPSAGIAIPFLESSARYPDQAFALDRTRDLNATWVRVDITWSGTEYVGRGVYRWSVYERMVDAIIARGMRPLAVLAYNNPLYAPTSKSGVATEANRRAYAAWARAAAEHFAGRIPAYEVWNEPNTSYFWQPGPNVSDYTALLKAAYPAIKSGDPQAFVIGGSIASSYEGIGPLDFLNGVYANGGAGYFDAISYHPYSGTLLPSNPKSNWALMTRPGSGFRDRMAANGDESKQLWATEFGNPTGGLDGNPQIVTEARQGEGITDALRLWKSYPWAGALFVHTLRDKVDVSPSSHDHHFGLFRADWSRKPAADAFVAGAPSAHTSSPSPASGGSGPRAVGVGRTRCDGLLPTILGTAKSDVIRGTSRRDVIVALGGNDVVHGLGGSDVICLGDGADRSFGGSGADRIFGQAGPDQLIGQAGPDRLVGGAGADIMLGGRGRDVLLGGTGRDRALGGGGRDVCSRHLTRSC